MAPVVLPDLHRGLAVTDTVDDRQQRLSLLRLLIDAGAEFDAFDGYEALDPVILASEARNLRMLRALISQGAPILKEYPSQTALHALARSDTHESQDLEEIVDLLVAAGLALDVHDSEGETPLCHAIRDNDLTFVRLLIERGADVNVETRSGDTPVLLAVGTANPAMVRMLMESGADPEVTGNLGLTAIELAERVGADEIAAYLRDPNVDDE
jgi:ankyrin repeat protein